MSKISLGKFKEMLDALFRYFPEKEKGFSLDWGTALSVSHIPTVHFSTQRQGEKGSREGIVNKDKQKGPVGLTHYT